VGTRAHVLAFGALLLVQVGCKSQPSGAVPAPSAVADPTGAVLPAPHGGTPCGELGCTQFDSVEEAFLAATRGDPRVIAIGEAHAQKGATAASSAKRFTETLLPLLEGRASDLLVELMNPPSACVARAAEVKKQQEVVTSHQAKTDQNEYVTMGEAAKKLGIVPDMLRPSCGDMDAIHDAGEDAIELSLSTIARLTAKKVEELVDRDTRTPKDANKVVVTYGGAIHHDRLPPKEREAWCFGPEVDAYVKGRYVEIDLYVPEYIEDTPAWKKLPWVAHYDRARLGAKATLFRPRERAFVIVFPESR
jgi:hypothetical protein